MHLIWYEVLNPFMFLSKRAETRARGACFSAQDGRLRLYAAEPATTRECGSSPDSISLIRYEVLNPFTSCRSAQKRERVERALRRWTAVYPYAAELAANPAA